MQTTTVKLSELKPSPDNVREYGSTEIDALADSIKTIGLLQSLVVKPNGKGYHVIAGGRRLAAMKSIKYNKPVPVTILDDDANLAEVSLSENIYRQPLKDHQIWQALLATNGGKVPTVKEAKAIAKRLHFTPDEIRQSATLAACHPDIVEGYINGDFNLSSLKAISVVDPDAQLEIMKHIIDSETPSYYLTSQIRKLIGFADYDMQRKLEYIGGAKAYRDAGGKMSSDLFSDDVIIHDPALLVQLYEAKLVEEDEQLARKHGLTVLPNLNDDSWRQTWVREEYATEADEERADEIRLTLREDDEIPDANREALEEELDSIMERTVIDLKEGYEYGVHHSRWYYRPIQTGDQQQEEVTETVTPLSGKATDFFKEEKLALMQRCIVEHADDPLYEAYSLCFILARNVCGPQRTRGYTAYLTVDGELPRKDWMTMQDDEEAYTEFTRQQPEEIAKDMAWTWTALFNKSLQDTFLSARVNQQTATNLWEVPEDFFSLYHRADQLDEIAEDMGLTEAKLVEFKGMKIKDKRSNLHHQATKLAQQGKHWMPEQLRFETIAK